MLVGNLAADIGFVYLDLAVHAYHYNVHSFPKAMQQEPGRLLGDAKPLGQLYTALS